MEPSNTYGLAVGGHPDSRLAAVVERWPTLPEAVRQAVVDLVAEAVGACVVDVSSVSTSAQIQKPRAKRGFR